jgi:glycosyltransferase involved in cell wall biosynthesis
VSDDNLRQLRVLHIVSEGGAPGALQQSLFMPLLTRMPKARVKAEVVVLSPGAAPSAVLRQNGAPVHDVALSRKRFSLRAFGEAVAAAKEFRPDIIQAWGATAQIAATFVRKRCGGKPKLIWSVAETAPLPRNAGFIDRQKHKYAAKLSHGADRIVYASEAGASHHRRAGFPEGGHVSIAPGVDATRFKPDPAARARVRDQLQLPANAFVIGMVAPFQPEYDHATLLKATGELIKTHPEIAVLLAGHGVQKGNAQLMALVGGGALGGRTHLLGEWSDAASLFNACDVVCSSALTDRARMTLAMAMLCGVPCVGTGMGAQGEVIGQFGVAIEPGSPSAFVKGLTRVLQLAPEKRAHMAQSARKHALKEYVYVRSLQRYLQLYFDLVGRESLATDVVQAPPPEVESMTPVVAAPVVAGTPSPRKPVLAVLADPDSLESKVEEAKEESLPKWRIEQEQKRAAMEAQQAPAAGPEGDVLEIFESNISAAPARATKPGEEASVEDFGELLAPEALESAAPAPKAPSPQQPRLVKPAAPAPAAPAAAKEDAAARMRAAAREELKRAAAMSAPAKPLAPSTPSVVESKPAPVEPAAPPAGELQLELLPDEPRQQASA